MMGRSLSLLVLSLFCGEAAWSRLSISARQSIFTDAFQGRRDSCTRLPELPEIDDH